MKKTVCLLVVIMLMLFAVTVAASVPSLTVEDTVVVAGQAQARVPVTLRGNEGIAGMLLIMEHDDAIRLAAIERGDALPTLEFTPPGKLNANPCNLLWDGEKADDSDGTLIFLVFDVPETVGEYFVEIRYRDGGVYDGDLVDIPMTVNSGNIIVTNGAEETDEDAAPETTKTSSDAASCTLILTIGEKAALLNGKSVENDVAPIIRENRTMLPARFVAESLGAEVFWDAEKQQVTVKKDGTLILLEIGKAEATVNGETKTLDSPAFIESDRTYTPVRFIAEALGASVAWDEATRRVTIIK